MKDAADYLAHIRALIIRDPKVRHWRVVREEVEGDLGLFRYRLVLRDGGELEMFERFQVVKGDVEVTKYSFHWQDAGGRLRKRWDNAPHYPDIPTHPHHVHDSGEMDAVPHGPVVAEDVLALVSQALDS